MARGGGRRVSSPGVKGTEENMEENSKRSGREVVVALLEKKRGEQVTRISRKGTISLDDDETKVGRRRSRFAILGDGLVDVEEGLVGVVDELGEGRGVGGGGRVERSEHTRGARDRTSSERCIVTGGDDL